MRFPKRFVDSIRRLLGSEAEDLLKSLEEPAFCGLRVNTSKISIEQFEQSAPYSIRKIPFTDNGYYINDTDAWSKHPYYFAGLYYLQEPSAMLPASVLPVKKGGAVLDMCAAPGGKSTQLLLYDPGILISNDISYSRTIPLVKNLEHWGGNYAVTCMDPKDLAVIYPKTFECIIVDAPCSGEGMFRKDASLISAYEERGPEYYRPVQESILDSAYEMLAPGGKIVYSTCTFSDIEDEQTIISFLNKHADICVLDIDKDHGLCGPYDIYGDNDCIKGCVHAFPHRFEGEGHFVALMEKSEENEHSLQRTSCSPACDFSSLPECVQEFAGYFSDSLYKRFTESSFIVGKDGQVFMLSGKLPDLYRKSVRYSRTGVYVGNIKKPGKFVPHTAFALNIRAEEFNNIISFPSDDPNVYKYLKGETIPIDMMKSDTPDIKKGYVLVCVESFPLGFASYDGNKLKNLYEKGWIYR